MSPRLGLVLRASPALSLTGSAYGGFRAPTLNELYRSFRVGDTLTLANAELEPERLWGGEAGVLATRLWILDHDMRAVKQEVNLEPADLNAIFSVHFVSY